MSKIIGVTVQRDMDGHSAFGIDETGALHRLSPSWVRDVKADKLHTFEVRLKEKGRVAKVQRLAPTKTGERVVTGESLALATSRALKALKLLAIGKTVDVPAVKAVA